MCSQLGGARPISRRWLTFPSPGLMRQERGLAWRGHWPPSTQRVILIFQSIFYLPRHAQFHEYNDIFRLYIDVLSFIGGQLIWQISLRGLRAVRAGPDINQAGAVRARGPQPVIVAWQVLQEGRFVKYSGEFAGEILTRLIVLLVAVGLRRNIPFILNTRI